MALQNRDKLNNLLRRWPSGTVGTVPWLEKQGISRQLAAQYLKNHWLERIGNGAFCRAGDRVEWPGGLWAIQEQLNLPIHLAGKSALTVLGFGHFISSQEALDLYLIGTPHRRLPRWFLDYAWGNSVDYKTSVLFKGGPENGLTQSTQNSLSITLSTPERAALEMLQLVPQVQEFSEAALIMEGLGTLRAELMQDLLEKCVSIKVKRLALMMGERFAHAWAKKIDQSKVDLGAGKRVIVHGGMLDHKYQLTVPGDFISKDDLSR